MASLRISLDGTTALPPGKIAAVVTYLETKEALPDEPAAPGLSVAPVERPGLAWYRALYRAIGEDWLWFSRAAMSDATLAALLARPATAILAVKRDGKDVGLAEIDFSAAGVAEIVAFGVLPEAVGSGAAALLMRRALAFAFARPVERVWLHTCTADHPAAMRFYRKMGFRPYQIAIEVADDPRLDGTLPADAAPHVPVIGAR